MPSPSNNSMIPFEMMACGLPVVDLDYNESSVTYGGSATALLVKPNPVDIALALERIMDSRALRAQYAKRGTMFAEALATEEQAITALEGILSDSAVAEERNLPDEAII